MIRILIYVYNTQTASSYCTFYTLRRRGGAGSRIFHTNAYFYTCDLIRYFRTRSA